MLLYRDERAITNKNYQHNVRAVRIFPMDAKFRYGNPAFTHRDAN